MKQLTFWIVALLCLTFNLFSLWDLWGTMSDIDGHLAGYPPAMVEMVRNFPQWKIIAWSTTVFIGVFGAVLLALRRALAERVLWAAAFFILINFVLDYALLNGAEAYGGFGTVANLAVVAIEALFALYASWAARHGLLR